MQHRLSLRQGLIISKIDFLDFHLLQQKQPDKERANNLVRSFDFVTY